MEDGSACGSRTQRSCQSPHFLILSSVKTCCVSKASRLRFSRPTYRASMEPAILAIHDFAPTVVGPTEPDRAATASAHDDTRSQDHPQLHQQAQNVLVMSYALVLCSMHHAVRIRGSRQLPREYDSSYHSVTISITYHVCISQIVISH